MWVRLSPCIPCFFVIVVVVVVFLPMLQLVSSCNLDRGDLGCPMIFSTFLISGADRPRGYPSGTNPKTRKHVPVSSGTWHSDNHSFYSTF